MPYRDDILALSPDHYWTFDGDYLDLGGSPDNRPANNVQSGTVGFVAVLLTEDSTQSMEIDGVTSRTECADVSDMNTGIQAQRTMCGWFMPSQIYRPPTAIYKEGGGSRNFAFTIGYGNIISAQAVENAGNLFDVQYYSDVPLTANRPYHLCFRFDGNAGADRFDFFLDGVLQSSSVGNPVGQANMRAHSGDINWGDFDTNLNVGGAATGFAGPTPGHFAHWASWTTPLSDADIYALFENGARALHTVTSQGELDALGTLEVSDYSIGIRVDIAGSVTLDASGISFARCSIDLQYMGTGTLTWEADSGSAAPTVTSTPGGGTVVINFPSLITFEGVQDGTEIRVYTLAGVELDGIESTSGGTWTASLPAGETVNVRIFALGFQPADLEGYVVPTSDASVPIQQVIDRQYENP